jgi:CRISPR-associated protein Cas2
LSHSARAFSEYRAVWLLAMFDLPVDSKESRMEYSNFRKALLKEGFSMLQYSVYARYCESEEASLVNRKRIRVALAPHGQVRILSVTDRQYGKMEIYIEKSKKKPESQPSQLILF